MPDPIDALAQKIKTAKTDIDPPRKPTTTHESKANANIVIEFMSAIIVPPLLGYWIDIRTETTPLFILLFLFMGVIGGTYNLYRTTQNISAKDSAKDDD